MQQRRASRRPSGGTPRLQDVADAAGVSIASASRALSGRDGVSSDLAEHVRRTALALGYVANLQARTLAGGAASTAGMLVYEINDPYFAEIASGALRVAAEHGWSVQISSTARDASAQAAQLRALRAHRVGAIIVTGSGYVDPHMDAEAVAELEVFAAAGGSVVVIGRHRLECDAVLPDNERAGRTIADHVLDLGHRRIAVAAGPAHLTTIADRLAGIRAALHDRGLDAGALTVEHAPFSREGGRTAVARILAARHDVTAVLALNDVMATGVLAELRDRGVAVPDDVSVTGFDDIQVAQDLAPALTTVRLPMAAIGATAMDLVLHPDGHGPRRRATGHELRVRASTAPPP